MSKEFKIKGVTLPTDKNSPVSENAERKKMLSSFQFLQPGLNFYWQIHLWQGVIQSSGPVLLPHMPITANPVWTYVKVMLDADTCRHLPEVASPSPGKWLPGWIWPRRQRWFCLIWRLFKWCSGNNRLLMKKVNLLIFNFLKLWLLIKNFLMSWMLVLIGR